MEHLCSWLNVFRVETSQHSICNFYMDLWIIRFVFLSWIDRISNWKRFERKGLTHMFRVDTSQHSICNFYMDLWMIRLVFLIQYNLISDWNIFAADSTCLEWKHLSIQFATFIWICEWLGLYFSYDTLVHLPFFFNKCYVFELVLEGRCAFRWG